MSTGMKTSSFICRGDLQLGASFRNFQREPQVFSQRIFSENVGISRHVCIYVSMYMSVCRGMAM